eukprot:scaffold2195_cov132-Cylindrotheca_fusiformis.AAC.3
MNELVNSLASTVLISNERNARPQEGITNKRLLLFSRWWQFYRQFIRRYRIPLELADEAIERLLYWIPHHGTKGPQWREALFGILSLHRLSMHCSEEPVLETSYGTSIQTLEDPEIPATFIRISLSVIHCLMPTLLEIIPLDSHRTRRQTALRKRLEQLKFGLRLYLLVSYWKQCWKTANQRQQLHSGDSVIGLLRGGGLFDLDQGAGLSMEEAQGLNRRQSYVGRRTGLTVVNSRPKGKSHLLHTILGELLHILRPLYWASSEANYSQQKQELTSNGSSKRILALFKSWFLTLVMDLSSLQLLVDHRYSGNKWAIEEWNRRKNRLMIYLLRAPIWSRLTIPVLKRCSTIWRKLPLLGQLIDVCLWDWVLYWKLPYVAEEG